MKKQSKHGRNNGGHRAVARDQVPTRLPQLTDQLSVGQTLRFVTTGIGGSTSTTVTYANLLDAWFIAGTATTAYQLFDFVKVRRVTIRAVGSNITGNNNQSVTVGIEYPAINNGALSAGNQVSNSNLGTTFPAFASLRPAKLSQNAQWQASTGAVAFVLRATQADNTVAVGAIIDVELSFKNSGDVNPAAVTSAIVAATPGNIYFGGIDGGRLAATWARSVFIPRL